MDLIVPSICVLVVDDEPLIRMDVSDIVAKAGFRVLEAASADEALRILQKQTDICVLLTDVEMPGSMDGVALAHRAHARAPGLHIIVTSGRRKIEAKDLPGEAVFLRKPCRPDHIVARLKAMTS
jgi:CheY-like chemotaxis protein